MKRILSVILTVVLLSLCGCEAQPSARRELTEISGLEDANCKYIVSADISGDDMALLGVRESEESLGYVLCLASVKDAKVYKTAEVNGDGFEGFSGVEFDGDGNVCVYYDYENKCLTFDRDLTQLGGIGEYASRDAFAEAHENALFDDTMSVYENCFQYYSDHKHYELVNAVGFLDDKDAVYSVKDRRFNVVSGCGKRLLTSYPLEGVPTGASVSVYDFDTSTVINTFDTPNPDGCASVSLATGKLAENAAFIVIEYGDGDPAQGEYYNKYFVWRYNENAQNTPFEARRYDADALNAQTAAVCDGIRDEYGVNVYVDKENEYQSADDSEYGYTFGLSPLKANIAAGILRDFFKACPKGFVTEMYRGVNDAVTGLDVYLVYGINGDPNAYANTFADRYYVCFEAYALSPETVYHEFMHIIEARVREYCYSVDKDIDIEWGRLNPPGFEYEISGAEHDFEKYEDYFVSGYAMRDYGEDRADTFMQMFAAGLDGEAPYRYEEGSPLADKVKLLADMIRAAYPSLKDADPPVWEAAFNKK